MSLMGKLYWFDHWIQQNLNFFSLLTLDFANLLVISYLNLSLLGLNLVNLQGFVNIFGFDHLNLFCCSGIEYIIQAMMGFE
jgi:hypothetical protein